LLGALAHALDALLGALAHAFDALLGALAHALDALLRAAADLRHALPGASSDVSERALGALPGTLDDVAGVAEQVVRAATDVPQRLADGFQQVRVAIQRGEHARKDRRHVVQASLEQRLGLDALDLELDLAESDSGAHVELDEAPGLGQHGEVRCEVVELELDLVDVDHRRIDVDVDRLFNVLRIDRRVVRQVLRRPVGVGRRPSIGAVGARSAVRARRHQPSPPDPRGCASTAQYPRWAVRMPWRAAPVAPRR
jgi:hypothetical protein